ncbi:uncharacterized protein LOC120700387 [Panicum virgatum]|uniref:uncharacterized protein LOC120700387 n=1 Tax=Panicum virgatum TaxID=38727 RepID=UPI0019D69E04|nr:uncharacterized protein LOC120700387 [Panicum virgatum]
MAGGGGDNTPEATAFKNVPRRPRSASPGSAPGPRKEELGASDGPARGGSSAPAAERRRLLLRPEDAKNGKEEAAAASASASSSRERGADWAKKERIRKGKMPAPEESPPRRIAYEDASASPRPAGKLMGDAIRSHGGSAAAARRSKMTPRRGSKTKKRKDRGGGPPFWYGMGRDGQSTSTAGSDLDYSFDKMGAVVSDELRAALRSLGVGAAAPQPLRVYGRMMSGCDRNTHQSRLQMSSKSWRAEDGDYPLCAFLTEKEKEAVEVGKGLAVTAYDRRGAPHDIRIGYLGSNRSYRLTKNWGHFLRDNDLVVKRAGKAAARAPNDVMLDLWLFRTPEGKVGMVIMHYRKGDAAHADAAFEEEERRSRPRLADNASTPEATSSPEPDGGAGGDDAAMEDVAGGADVKGQDGAGAQGDAAGAPSPSDPDGGGGGAKAGEAEQAEVAAAPLSPDADGTKTEEKEAGGAPKEAAAHSSSEGVMEKKGAGAAPGDADGTKAEEKEASCAAPTEAAAQSSSSDTASGAANAEGKEAAPLPAAGSGGAKNGDGPAPPVAAAPFWFGFGLTQHEVLAAHALVLLSLG